MFFAFSKMKILFLCQNCKIVSFKMVPLFNSYCYVLLDRVSVPSPIAVDILMVHNGEGQSSHVLVSCVNFERHICRHITTSIKCYLHSLRYVYVPFTNILCQSNKACIYLNLFYKCKQIFNVTKLSTKEIPGF